MKLLKHLTLSILIFTIPALHAFDIDTVRPLPLAAPEEEQRQSQPNVAEIVTAIASTISAVGVCIMLYTLYKVGQAAKSIPHQTEEFLEGKTAILRNFAQKNDISPENVKEAFKIINSVAKHFLGAENVVTNDDAATPSNTGTPV